MKLTTHYDDRREIIVPGDAHDTIVFAVEQLIATANAAIEARNVCAIALSGGSTPKAIFEKLANEPYRNQVDWSRVYLFWSDERSVAPDHPESNYGMAMEAGLKRLPIAPSHIFRMPADGDVVEGAASYDALLSSKLPSGKFDLVMLGMGEDGHTASLFPHTEALSAKNSLAAANYVPQKETWRMTLTYPCINAARHIVIYVIGKSKAAMLKHVLTAPYQPSDLPIQAVGTSSNKAVWVVDRDAASDLRLT